MKALLSSPLHNFWILVLYTVLAVAMSYPLILNLGTQIPGVEGDVWSYLWALGWARIALLDLGINPFHSDYIYYPLGGASQLLWGTALPSFAAIPLDLTLGMAPAFNLMYLMAIVLTGFGTYLLALYTLRQAGIFQAGASRDNLLRLGALVSGAVFAFCALRLGYGLAFTNLYHTEWIPFYVLYLLKTTNESGRKNALLAGFFFALNVYVDFQIAAFLAIFTALWLSYLTVRTLLASRRPTKVKLPALPWKRGAAMTFFAAVLISPMALLVLNDFAIEGGNYIRVYPLRYSADRSYDLLSYVLPNARSSFYGAMPFLRVEGVNASLTTPDVSELSPDRQAFLGYTVLVLAIVGAVTRPRSSFFWVLSAHVFYILSLGPILHVAGAVTALPLPFAVMNSIPLANHIRIPMRYGIMVFLAVSILAGIGSVRVMSMNRWFVVPLFLLILLEAAVLPYPTLDFVVPRFYQRLARDEDDYAILEIPSFNWRFAAKNEAYQPIHRKRLLRAYTNRIAPDLADYFGSRQTPIVVRSLRILEGAEEGVLTEEEIEEDRAVTNDLTRFFNIRYAVLHHDQLDPQRAAVIDSYLREVLDAKVVEKDEDITAYALTSAQPASDVLELDLAQDSSLMYLGRGWQTEPLATLDEEAGRFLKGTTSELFLPATPKVGTIEIRAWAANPTSVELLYDGFPIKVLNLPAGWTSASVSVPESVGGALQRLVIRHPGVSELLAISSILQK